MNSKQSQIEGVQAALLAGEPVNQVEAIKRGWGLRLGALVHRLRGRGWPILAERDHNNGLAHYRLPDGWKPPTHTPTGKPAATGRKSTISGILTGDRHPDSTPHTRIKKPVNGSTLTGWNDTFF